MKYKLPKSSNLLKLRSIVLATLQKTGLHLPVKPLNWFICIYLKSATWKTNTWYLSTLSHRSSWATFYCHWTGYTLNSLEWSSPSLYASTIGIKLASVFTTLVFLFFVFCFCFVCLLCVLLLFLLLLFLHFIYNSRSI
jgi:hypothetical protein